jgi:hypothetical protein
VIDGKRVAVVVPARDEETLLPVTLAGMPDFVDRVYVVDDASADATVVEVHAADGLGVLHRLTAALDECGLDVRSAHLSTLGADVVDAFYVVGPDARHVGVQRQLAFGLEDVHARTEVLRVPRRLDVLSRSAFGQAIAIVLRHGIGLLCRLCVGNDSRRVGLWPAR